MLNYQRCISAKILYLVDTMFISNLKLMENLCFYQKFRIDNNNRKK